jgi:hypothetical protein
LTSLKGSLIFVSEARAYAQSGVFVTGKP